jgi:hypothetical protein
VAPVFIYVLYKISLGYGIKLQGSLKICTKKSKFGVTIQQYAVNQPVLFVI